jgi:glycosyltransferase involved in cell wall biosynthesis
LNKLLVISHEATRTGAPILLLHFLKALKKRNSTLVIDIILPSGGALADEFSAIGNTLLIDQSPKEYSLFYRLYRKVANTFKKGAIKSYQDKQIVQFVSKKKYDVIFSNTIVNGYILNTLRLMNCRVVSYIHELEPSIQRLTSPESLAYVLNYTNHFIVPSKVVRDNLIDKHKVPLAKITVLPSYIPEVIVNPLRKNELIQKLGLEGNYVIGGMGSMGLRKGSDLFLQACIKMKKNGDNRKIKFLWVGADKTSEEYKSIISRAIEAGVEEGLIVVESVDNPVEYLSVMDIFLLTSREDPYPLVVLEAAMQHKPAICFENSGGATEFISSYGGAIVPNMDVDILCREALSIIEQLEKRELIGVAAYNSYLNKHSEAAALPILEGILDI